MSRLGVRLTAGVVASGVVAGHIAERLAQPDDLAALYVAFGLLAAVGALVVFIIVIGLHAIARHEVGWQPDRDEPGATRDR